MTELICIGCPKGCRLTVNENNDFTVTGNKCEIGARYGKEELVNPTRTLTSTIRIKGLENRVCPVKSDKPLPKTLLLEAMRIINENSVSLPIEMHQVIIENILDTGINIIATKEVFE